MDRAVIRLRAATGENDFVRLTPEQICHSLMREVGCFLHLGTETMRAGRVAVAAGKEGHHFLQHRGIDPGAGVVVEIDDFRISRHN